MPDNQKIWDIIVVGGGPAGLSAATVLARSRRSVLIIDEGKQRNLRSHGLHNYLTRDGILPPDFLELAAAELNNYPIAIHKEKVVLATKEEDGFRLGTEVDQYRCRRLLIATGVTDHVPDIPGMRELWGNSVFHCPFCDGYECKDTIVGLYARKYNGYGMALALRHLTEKVILFTDGAYYLKLSQRRELERRGVDVITKKIQRLQHDGKKLFSVELDGGITIPCNSLFTHHGFSVNNDLLLQLGCKCSGKGPAVTNRKQQTSVEGVYAAGDASFDMHFVIVAAAEGVKAGVAIHNDLLKEDQNQ